MWIVFGGFDLVRCIQITSLIHQKAVEMILLFSLCSQTKKHKTIIGPTEARTRDLWHMERTLCHSSTES